MTLDPDPAALLEGVDGAVAVTDGAGRVRTANTAAEGWLGGAGEDWAAPFPATDAAVAHALATAADTGAVTACLPHGDAWLTARVTPADGGHIVHVRDITAECREYRAQAARARQLTDLVDNLPALVAEVDANGRYTRVNHGYGAWFDEAPGQLVGRSIADLVGRETYVRLMPYIRRALRGEPGRLELTADLPALGRRDILVHYVPRRTATGMPDGYYTMVLDVSEWRTAERRLAERERFLDTLTRLIPGVVYYQDADGRFHFMSARFAEWFGLAPETLAGRAFADAYPDRPDPLAPVAPAAATALQGETGHVATGVDRAGDTRWVDATCVPHCDGDGRVVGVVGLVLDVSEQRAAEAALRDSEAWFRSIFDNAPTGIVVSDDAFRIRRANPAFQCMVGHDEDTLCRETWAAITHPEDLTVSYTAHHDLEAAPDATTSLEKRYIHADGRIVWGSVNLVSVPDPRTGDTMRIALVRDETARKEAEARLAESEERYALAIDGTSDGIWDLDYASGTVRGTDRCLTLLGHPPGPDGGGTLRPWKAWLRAVHSDDRADLLAAYREHRAGRAGRLEATARLRRADGAWMWMLVRGQVLADADGAPYRAVGALTDIDRRVRLEHALRDAKEAAERASSDKTRFLAAASHDLRQPVQALRLFAGLLAGRDDLPEQARTVVGRLENTVESLSDLLGALLDISKLDAGMVVPRVRDVAVQPVIERVVDAFRETAAARGLRFRGVPSSLRAHTDPALLETMLYNLAANAVKFTDAGGVVVGVRPAGDRVHVMVADSGPGVPDAQQGLIFHDYYRAPGEGAGREGLGLGLAIVRRMAALLDHRVWVQSAPGRGTRFTIELPPAERTAGAAAPAGGEPGPERLAGRTVLVLEDDADIRTALAALFARWRCRVVAPDDPAAPDLAENLRAEAPDLVVADYRLPGNTTGVDVVRALRHALDRPVPAVLLTADTAPEGLLAARESGLALLHKPVDSRRLLAALADALDGY